MSWDRPSGTGGGESPERQRPRDSPREGDGQRAPGADVGRRDWQPEDYVPYTRGEAFAEGMARKPSSEGGPELGSAEWLEGKARLWERRAAGEDVEIPGRDIPFTTRDVREWAGSPDRDRLPRPGTPVWQALQAERARESAGNVGASGPERPAAAAGGGRDRGDDHPDRAGRRPGHPDITVRYPADYRPSSGDAPLPRVDGPHVSPEGWAGAINPRDPGRFDGTRSYNCGECSRAVDGTWQGYPKVAAAIDFPRLWGEPKERMEEWAGTECTGASMTEIKQELDRLGPGSSGIVGVYWNSRGGHWFNAVNDAGTIKAVDGQSGEIEIWPPSNSGLGFSEARMKESFVIYVKPDGEIVK